MSTTPQRWKTRFDVLIAYLKSTGMTFPKDLSYSEALFVMDNSPRLSANDKAEIKSIYDRFIEESDFDVDDPVERSKGIRDFSYICTHHPSEIIHRLALDEDYAMLFDREKLKEEQAKRAARLRKWKYVFGAVALIAVAIIIYHLPYFAEKRAYQRTFDDPSVYTFHQYLDNYDNPDHTPDVLFRLAMLKLNSYAGVGESKQRNCLNTFDELLNRYPGHELSWRAKVVSDSIWDAEIERFKNNNPDFESSPSLKAMYGMLSYMHQNRIHDITLNVTSDLDLRDYEDFDKNIRDFLEVFDNDLKTKGVLSLKNNFTSADRNSLEEILTNGFESSLNSLFTRDFFSVNIAKNNEIIDSVNPVIDLHYSIRSQIDHFGDNEIPHLWVYTSESSSPYTAKDEEYIMGISVDFKSALSYPGLTEPWNIAMEGSPADNISGIENLSEGYRIMTSRCFHQFSNQLSASLGFEQMAVES
ncbi:MAG: hypothetical protein NC098_03775 [Lachnoclostridium sp.]|nr:hypothetical protein [Lachnoclostridium sp.]